MPHSPRARLLALLSILVIALPFLDPVQAHSSPWPTITRSEHILNLRHDILPRIAPFDSHQGQPLAKRNLDSILATNPGRIARHDTVRLQFSAYNTTFHLYLEPNHDLIHPEADLGHGIDLDDIMPFKGVVVQDEYASNRRWDRAASTSRESKRPVEHMLTEEGVLGWARMMIEHDPQDHSLVLRGAFMVEDDTYHVTSRQHYHVQKRSDDASPSAQAESEVVIYRDSDLYRPSKKRSLATTGAQTTCGSDSILNKTDPPPQYEYYYPPDQTATMPVPMFGSLSSSSSWTDVLRSPLMKREVSMLVAGPNPVPPGCPPNRLVNYMGVAADCAYVRAYAGVAGARKQIFADFNTASAIYEGTFNIALGIIALNIKSESCPTTVVDGEKWNRDCSDTYQIDQRLSDFSEWRGQPERSRDGAGLWHLMTKCNSGPVVGIAWTKALCQAGTNQQSSNGRLQFTAGTGVSSITPNEWMVVAHEIGHGFGAVHDCTASTCPPSGGDDKCCPLSTTSCDAGARYIMNPSESVETRVFSPCSIRTICGTIQGSAGKCLQPPGSRSTQTGQANICGNGLKEVGEDCDCGSPEDCAKDPCCDGATCKFKNGAICDDLNDDCCQNCKMRPAGQVCRQAISECDLQEVCSGTSATCPPDVRIDDLTPCGNSTGLQCAKGVCTSRDLQCQQQDRGMTKGCGVSNSCDLMCNDPAGSLACMLIPGASFLDGTPCGFGGTCSAGSCEYSNGIKGVLAWANEHLAIVIPVGIVVGLLVIGCIWSCCCTKACQSRQRKKAIRGPSRLRPNRQGSAGQSRSGGPPTPGSSRRGPLAVGSARHDQQYAMEPVAPPPVYYDPATRSAAAGHLSREDQEMQMALEESRREHERQSSMNMAGHTTQPSPYTQNAAMIAASQAPSSSQSPWTGSGRGQAMVDPSFQPTYQPQQQQDPSQLLLGSAFQHPDQSPLPQAGQLPVQESAPQQRYSPPSIPPQPLEGSMSSSPYPQQQQQQYAPPPSSLY